MTRRGLTQAEIAAELEISIRTVETHAARIRAKLGIEATRDVLRVRGRDRGARS